MNKTTASQLTLLAVCCCAMNAIGCIFWVTPHYQKSCHNRTPCDTIDGYYQRNSSIFSTSDVTWIFLEGEHFTAERGIVIERAQNVTIKGNLNFNSSIYFAQIECPLVISFSKNVTIENLKIHFFRDTKYVHQTEVHLKIVLVHNLIIENITWLTASATYFGCYDISGISKIRGTTFSGEFMIIFEFRRVPLSGNKSKILSLNIQHTSFWNTRGIELRNRPYLKTLYDYITISIENCQFFGYWSMFLMQTNQFGLANIKIANSSFIFNDYLFDRMTSGVNAISIYISTNKSALQQAATPLVIVLIDNCILTMPISVTFDYRKVELEAFKNGEFSMFARIAIQNTVIKHSIQSCQFSSYFSAEFIPPRKQLWLTSIKNLTELRKPTLILINCTFDIKNCFTDFDIAIRPSFKPKIMTLINFQQFYVYIHNLSIFSGDGIGLLLDESIVYLRGINRIENFKIDLSYYSTFVGIKMTFNSRILLDDSSLLRVHADESSEGGILVDPMGYLNPSNHPDDEYYNDYTNCLMYHTECSGLCFYQIVGKGGKLRSEQEINRSKSSMYIFGYPIKISGFKLYNGHLQNCTMETLTGLTVLNQTFHERHIKTTVIDLHFDSEYDIKSPPYQICLCNENDKLNKTLWLCNHETNFSVYPGQNLTFLVAVIGDIGAIIKDREVEVINSINPKNKQIVTVDSECKNILTYQPFQNLQISFVTVENSAKDFSIRRKANIHLLEYCPIGLQRNNISNKLTCTCNAVLNLNDLSAASAQKKM